MVRLRADIYQTPPPANLRQARTVGAGPAGLFAALRAIELGIFPLNKTAASCARAG